MSYEVTKYQRAFLQLAHDQLEQMRVSFAREVNAIRAEIGAPDDYIYDGATGTFRERTVAERIAIQDEVPAHEM